MSYPSYIHLTDEFIDGLGNYVKKKGIPLDEVVEVFAGNGQLGLRLGLKSRCNITDSLLYASDDYQDEVNKDWDKQPHGVAVETAYETILRFSAEDGLNIRLLIMGAPLPALSYYCPSYEAAKALYHRFDAQILYIGELSDFAFASPKFFAHVQQVQDDDEQSFQTLVADRYDSKHGYFASEAFETPLDIRPFLLRFAPCSDERCDCRDDAKICGDVQAYGRKYSSVR